MTNRKSFHTDWPGIIPTAALLVTLLFLLSCQKTPEKLPNLRIGHAPHDHHAALYIAAMNPDFFKQKGGIYLQEITFRKQYRLMVEEKPVANVTLQSSTGGTELIRKLNENFYDMSFGGFPAMIKFMDQGSPIKIIAPAMSEGAGLVVRHDMPANNWQEFMTYATQQKQPIKIGYKIAVSVQNLIFEQALQAEGIPFSKQLAHRDATIVIVNLFGAKNLIPAMKDGIIDGFVVNQPFLALAEASGLGKTITMLADMPPQGKWEGSPCCAVAGNNDFIKANPEVTATMLTLLLRANQLIIEQPERSAEQIAQWLGVDPEIEKRSLASIKFVLDFDTSWNRGVHNWIETMIQNKALTDQVKKAYSEDRIDQFLYNWDLYHRAKEDM